jgi:hypothetical protein
MMPNVWFYGSSMQALLCTLMVLWNQQIGQEIGISRWNGSVMVCDMNLGFGAGEE